MHEAELFTTAGAAGVQCEACLWRCQLQPDVLGRCNVRIGREGGIELLAHSLISGASIGPIEDQRLWHFFPDTLAFAVGSYGYAFPADQQRAPYAQLPTEESKRRELSPDRAATFALERLCRGVIWAYNEPAVSFEYVRDLLQLSRASSRYTALVSGGFFTHAAIDQISPYLDGLSFELRGFSDASYARLAGIDQWREVLESIAYMRSKRYLHLEITTRIHHGVNDNSAELRALVAWIVETIGPQTPWHVLPGDAGAETAAATLRARRIGHEGGLAFVYGVEPNQETRCPACQSTLITRHDGVTRLPGLHGEVCAECGEKINVHLSIFKGRH